MAKHRPGELEAIERFIRENGVTKEPTAFGAPTEGATLTADEMAEHKQHGEVRAQMQAEKARKSLSKAAKLERKQYIAFCIELAPVIEAIRRENKTLSAIAKVLNERDIKSFKGRRWFPSTVRSVLAHAEKDAAAEN